MKTEMLQNTSLTSLCFTSPMGNEKKMVNVWAKRCKEKSHYPSPFKSWMGWTEDG